MGYIVRPSPNGKKYTHHICLFLDVLESINHLYNSLQNIPYWPSASHHHTYMHLVQKATVASIVSGFYYSICYWQAWLTLGLEKLLSGQCASYHV